MPEAKGTSTRRFIEPVLGHRRTSPSPARDFSAQLPIAAGLVGNKPLPPVRFDFVVQTRVLSPQAAQQFRKEARTAPRDQTAYPQREAVLFALAR